jgi:hypothetical protein
MAAVAKHSRRMTSSQLENNFHYNHDHGLKYTSLPLDELSIDLPIHQGPP